MAVHPNKITQVLLSAQRPVGLKELLRLMALNPGHQTELKRQLRDMLRAGEVARDGKRFFVPGARQPREAPATAAPRGGGKTLGAGRPAALGKQRTERTQRRGGGPRDREQPRRRKGGFDESRSGRPRSAGDDRRGARQGGAAERGRRARGLPYDEIARRSRGVVQEQEGILHVHRDGFGFVHPTSGEGENIYLPPEEASRALDHDRVKIEIVHERGRPTGRVVEVLSRVRENAVGIYFDRGRDSYVEPADKNLAGPILVPRSQLARDGDLVKVRLLGADELIGARGLRGEVAGSLGKPGDPSAEVLSIAFSQGFSDEFPPEVMAEAEDVAHPVTEEEALAPGRHDLRSLPLVTIDGEDARDFDDAICVRAETNGYHLWVAIADVAHYVKEKSPLDLEALKRATSVYLPDRVLPMLPERLSNGMCSLRPDETRLCLVAELTFDHAGEVTSERVYPGVMKSRARCTYNEVQAVLDGQDVPHRNHLMPNFQAIRALTRVLTQMRQRRGALDFDLPETRVVLSDDGTPLRLERRERKESHRMVEECMLAANECVARYFQKRGLPSVYRFHGEPDETKLEAFAALAKAHGFYLGHKGKVSSKDLSQFLEKLQGHPEQRVLNQLLLRSMMQAVYSSEQFGHFGLAAENYLHFTSPIRRYPDLLVHRLLKLHWEGQAPRSDVAKDTQTNRLEQMAVQSSERERAAMQVEREVVAFYSTLMMRDRVGEIFSATVSSVTDFGFFVELDNLWVEGLVHGEKLGRFRFDPVRHELLFPASGRKIKVGEPLQVQLVAANLSRRQLEFSVVEDVSAVGEVNVPMSAIRRRLQGLGGDRGPLPAREPPPRHKGGPKSGGRPGSRGSRRR